MIDTNWLLDLWVFQDPRAQTLRHALETGQVQWLATTEMRAEFERVLGYPAVTRWRQRHEAGLSNPLTAFDRHHHPTPPAPACDVHCRDPDDQAFIDLAVAHRARLLSKDRAVLALRRPLARLGVAVSADWLE